LFEVHNTIMKAVTILEKGRVGVIDREEPQMRPDYIKVKAIAVGINPSMFS
jgi:NADPH:quinone reductase-like Zn-dependent oxidoreductase